MNKSAVLVAALIGMSTLASAAAEADELLVSGRVVSILLLPSGSEHCPDLSAPSKNADGAQHVSISNDGGCQQATIKVSHTLLGKPQPATITIATRIGEFGRPSLPLQASDILIYADGGTRRWSELAQKNGVVFFEAKPFKTVGGVQIAALPHDGDGDIALASLVDKLRTSAH